MSARAVLRHDRRRGGPGRVGFADLPDVLTPGRYVGAADVEDDGVPFAERFAALKANLEGQFLEAQRLQAAIQSSLEQI